MTNQINIIIKYTILFCFLSLNLPDLPKLSDVLNSSELFDLSKLSDILFDSLHDVLSDSY